MSGEKYHADGDCWPEVCRMCQMADANMREDHERKVCDQYPKCQICEDEHDCDEKYEAKCPSCVKVYA